MPPESTARAESLCLARPHVPPRSRCFHLEPRGVGTPYVESLSGYAARLAEKHSVTTNHLFSKEVALYINKPGAITASVNFEKFAKAVNGTGVIAADLVSVFERLTLRRDLRFTTLMAWGKILADRSLIREARAWCPACYGDQAETGSGAYDQLIWAIKAVSLCGKHKTPLELECPRCNRRQQHLTFRSRPGYCSSCKAWLGSKERGGVSGEGAPAPRADSRTGLRITEWLGALLAATPGLDWTAATSNFAANLANHLQAQYHGRPTVIWRATSVTAPTVRSWLRGERLPSLDKLLKVCLALNVSLADLVCATPEGATPSGVVNKPGGPPRTPAGLKGDSEGRGGKGRRFPRSHWSRPDVLAEIEKELRASLNEDPPRSLTKISADIGCNIRTLKRKFPEITMKITERSLAYYRPKMDVERAVKVLRLACVEAPPPSLSEVSRRLGPGHASASLMDKFPQECHTIIERYVSRFRRPVDYDVVEKSLRDSLSERPAQSLASLCRRLGVAEPNVQKKLPELCASVRRRYVLHQREATARRRALVTDEITSNVKSMVRDGIRPTVGLLFAMRKVPCGSARYHRECLRILGEFGLR